MRHEITRQGLDKMIRLQAKLGLPQVGVIEYLEAPTLESVQEWIGEVGTTIEQIRSDFEVDGQGIQIFVDEDGDRKNLAPNPLVAALCDHSYYGADVKIVGRAVILVGTARWLE